MSTPRNSIYREADKTEIKTEYEIKEYIEEEKWS